MAESRKRGQFRQTGPNRKSLSDPVSIEPLRRKPNRREENKNLNSRSLDKMPLSRAVMAEQASKKQAAADEVFITEFVTETYQELRIVGSFGITDATSRSRFKGQIPFLPNRRDRVTARDHSNPWEVLRVEHVFSTSKNIPTRVFIVLRPIDLTAKLRKAEQIQVSDHLAKFKVILDSLAADFSATNTEPVALLQEDDGDWRMSKVYRNEGLFTEDEEGGALSFTGERKIRKIMDAKILDAKEVNEYLIRMNLQPDTKGWFTVSLQVED
ncbi:MAG TPA: hypothetical protein ENI23_05450 [bacterium]|nr:hypothetical protein [bacterium]